MKKIFMIPVLFAVLILCFAQKSQAQVTNPYPQQMNWYMNSIMTRKAIENRNRRKSGAAAKRRVVKRRVVRRRARRVSIIEPLFLPKRIEIV